MKIKLQKIHVTYLLLFIINDIMLITNGLDIKIFIGGYEELWGSGNPNYVYLLTLNLIIVLAIVLINLILFLNKNNKTKFKWLIFLIITIFSLFIPIALDKKIDIVTGNEEIKYLNIVKMISKAF